MLLLSLGFSCCFLEFKERGLADDFSRGFNIISTFMLLLVCQQNGLVRTKIWTYIWRTKVDQVSPTWRSIEISYACWSYNSQETRKMDSAQKDVILTSIHHRRGFLSTWCLVWSSCMNFEIKTDCHLVWTWVGPSIRLSQYWLSCSVCIMVIAN